MTEELKKEKQQWEASDLNMNDMIEQWWAQMTEKEKERSQTRSRMEFLDKNQRLDVLAQIEQGFSSLISAQVVRCP